MGQRPFQPAEDLWWALVVTSLRDDLPDNVSLSFDEASHVMALDVDGARMHMQRLHGGRAVVWGRVTFPGSFDPDVLDGAPTWVGSDALRNARGDDSAEFLAWYERGDWDSNHIDWWQEHRVLFHVLRTTHRGTIGLAMRGELDHPVAVAARGAAPVNNQSGVRHHITRSVHAQMRETLEVDRGHPMQPMQLVKWARVLKPRPFDALVRVDKGAVELLKGPPGEQGQRLAAVLQELHRYEATDDSGGWLTARVAYDGRSITLQRAFDSLPPWYDAEPPTLDALAWEMLQRSPHWRPGWVRLLPGPR